MEPFRVPPHLPEEEGSLLVLRRGEHQEGQHHAPVQFDVVREFANASLVFGPVDAVFEDDQQIDVRIEPALLVAGDTPIQYYGLDCVPVPVTNTSSEGLGGLVVYGLVPLGHAGSLVVSVNKRSSAGWPHRRFLATGAVSPGQAAFS
jgi:hypothetical protein